MPITAASVVFLLLTCLFLPWMAMKSAWRTRKPGGTPSRTQYVTSVFLVQFFMLFLALSAARYDEISLFPMPDWGLSNALILLVFLAIALGTMPWRWNWKTPEEKRRMRWILPQSLRDLSWWPFVSLTAGIVEEIVYRGVMYVLWRRITGEVWLATAICVVAFSLAHFVQGWKGMVLIAVMSVGFHLIVFATGDLYTAMAGHFLYDLLAGFIILRLTQRDEQAPAGSSIP
jgi:membrane protease YdiL (CAAX protease family)